ncbi:MAG: hypothetical protein GX346_06020 [Clostridiales bacterium]|nr:hypothetical protein [Clostridiales bacterium]
MEFFNFDKRLLKNAEIAENMCKDAFARIDEITDYNMQKVLNAFIECRVSDSHFKGTTGYGYSDMGRDKLEEVFAKSFGGEDALVRHSFASGTHTIATVLYGILRPNDKAVCVTGTPYDTLHEVVWGKGKGSLEDFGIDFSVVDLDNDGNIDITNAEKAVFDKNVKMIYFQRSRGYSLRPSFSVEYLAEVIELLKKANPDACIVVDNCYGEFCERLEPVQAGADIIVGSLIKNPGGGIAKNGGYIVGRADLIEQCAYRLTTPSTGKEVGASLNELREMFLGLFNAPMAVCGALKTAVFASALFESFGYKAYPRYNESRADIINAIELGGEKELIAFCRGIQAGSPIDSFAYPEPWEMPGYDSKVIMAAGAFTMGASIELSADAPLREPFAVWLQGGLNYPSGKVGILKAAQTMSDEGLLKLD